MRIQIHNGTQHSLPILKQATRRAKSDVQGTKETESAFTEIDRKFQIWKVDPHWTSTNNEFYYKDLHNKSKVSKARESDRNSEKITVAE